MMARKVPSKSVSIVIGIMLVAGLFLPVALCQSAPVQRQRPPRAASQPKPLSLPHLYWHFLVYQNHLDTKATELDSQGKNGSLMRHYLQHRIGLTDSEFAPIRMSSARLSAEVKNLDAQALAVQATGMSSANVDQLRALTVQREASINAEVTFLRQALPPERIKILESFLVQFYSPANAVPRLSPPSSQPAPAAVQQ
jgi:hypothetical protein